MMAGREDNESATILCIDAVKPTFGRFSRNLQLRGTPRGVILNFALISAVTACRSLKQGSIEQQSL